MPPKGNSSSSNRGASSDSEDEGTKTRIPKLPQLQGDNYDAWERKVKHTFYAPKCLPLYEASKIGKGEAGARVGGFSESLRQKAWGVVLGSLDDDMTAKIDKVKLGEVEELLRELEAQFYRNTMQTKTMLMEQLLSTKLDQHPDLDAYITAMETQTKKLIGMGDNIDDEKRTFYLLRGLPAEYDSIRAVITIPGQKSRTEVDLGANTILTSRSRNEIWHSWRQKQGQVWQRQNISCK